MTQDALSLNILIVDDDKMLCDMLNQRIKRLGHNSKAVHTTQKALSEAETSSFDVVFLDVDLPDGNGLEIIPDVRSASSRPEVIIITGVGSPEGADLAIRNGAWDYIQKPFSAQEIALQLNQIVQYRKEQSAGRKTVVLRREQIIGSSEPINTCLKLIGNAAASNASVLITGETGTGKELVAKAIHENSERAINNFVVVDCASLTETLVESTLFGHEKGAYTGADRSQTGLIRQADGGTLFLDEVGEMPMAVQKKFLRVLQEHSMRPVGSHKEVKSNFRLLAATNRNLENAVQNGTFRQDLLFRLHTVTIDVPPLRARKTDIKALAVFYLSKFSEQYGFITKGISRDFLELLSRYDWPGNVRELVNTMESIVTSAQDATTLFPIHLPLRIRSNLVRKTLKETEEKGIPASQDKAYSSLESFPSLKQLIESTEEQYMQELMLHTDFDIKRACHTSGLSRSRLYSRLQKYKIQRSDISE